MIRTEAEYKAAQAKIRQDAEFANQQRRAYKESGLDEAQVEYVMQPLLSFQAGLREEVAWYERIKHGDFGTLLSLRALGRTLIALRIAAGLTQRELAERLGVSEAAVSRDEKNEYHGVSVEKAQRVLEALNGRVTATVTQSFKGGLGEKPELAVT